MGFDTGGSSQTGPTTNVLLLDGNACETIGFMVRNLRTPGGGSRIVTVGEVC